MDLAHLVHALSARLFRSPAVHLALIGALIFAFTAQQRPAEQGPSETERQTVVIPAARIALGLEQFQEMLGRLPTPTERQAAVDFVVEQEILYQHALNLKMDRDPVTERRLAQIASFVAENPHEALPTSKRAMEAREIGLGHGDLVTRRLMIDGARRLIRAGGLVREPTEEALEEYLRENPAVFERPGRLRVSHVVLLSRLHGQQAEEDARQLLTRLRDGSLSPDEAAALGDESVVPSSLPPLPDRELQRRLGHRFVEQLAELPEGSWQGPVRSKYGMHLVLIHERIPPRVPALAEVRRQVRSRVRQQLADQHLAFRLEQLRGEYDIVMEGTS